MPSPTFTTHPPLPKMDHTAGHKHSQYHPTIGRVICTLIESGLTVRQVAAHRDMPSYCTFFQWRKMNPDFDDRYRAMRGRMAKVRVAAAVGELEAARAARAELAKAQGRRPRDWVSGKKSSYEQAWAQTYCDAIARGKSGYELARDPTMPTAKAVYRWLRRFAEFREMYAEAHRQQGVTFMLDTHAVADTLDEAPFNFPWVKRQVARIQGRQGRLEAKVWG